MGNADAEETKRMKAKNLRYKKPIAKGLTLDDIREALWDIMDACADVQYYVDQDDETLVNALDGDEDDAFEFKMMFADLTAECEQMDRDLQETYIPEYFDLFFVAVNKGGEMLGFDTYERDYFGLDGFEGELASKEAAKKMKRLTKDQLIEAAQVCFKVYQSFIGLQYRYDCIKAALDILRDENTGRLQMVRRIEEAYVRADEETDGFRWDFRGGPALKELESLIGNLPQEAWVQ